MTCGSVTAVVTAGTLRLASGVVGVTPDMLDAAKSTCQQKYPNARQRIPSTDDLDKDPYATGNCYRGALGELAMTVRAAGIDVMAARADYDAHMQAYDIAMKSCEIAKAGDEAILEAMKSHDQEMTQLGIGKLACDIAAEVADASKECFDAFGEIEEDMTGMAVGVCLSAVAESAAKATSEGLEFAMKQADMAHEELVKTIENNTDDLKCVNDASSNLVGVKGDALRVQRAMADQSLAIYRLNQGVISAQSDWDDGQAALQKGKDRTVRPPDLDAWVDAKVAAYQRAMHRARRFVYLAVRAVEYEFQYTEKARDAVLAAQTPAELQTVIDGLLDVSRTNRINGNRPSSLEAVLSLRQHLLQLQDKSNIDPAEQRLTDVQRLRLVLQDPRFAMFDDNGTYQGQRIPFSLVPLSTNHLGDPAGIPILAAQDCAERIWSVNASVLGDPQKLVVGDQSTFTRMDLFKANAFYSQWCVAPDSSQPEVQKASVRPTINLFRDPEYGATSQGSTPIGSTLGVSNGIQNFSRARMQPRLNVSRADFESTTYANGETSELAARGLYGDYALFIPVGVISMTKSDGSRTSGLNLDAVDDILLRIDYVSAARN